MAKTTRVKRTLYFDRGLDRYVLVIYAPGSCRSRHHKLPKGLTEAEAKARAKGITNTQPT